MEHFLLLVLVMFIKSCFFHLFYDMDNTLNVCTRKYGYGKNSFILIIGQNKLHDRLLQLNGLIHIVSLSLTILGHKQISIEGGNQYIRGSFNIFLFILIYHFTNLDGGKYDIEIEVETDVSILKLEVGNCMFHQHYTSFMLDNITQRKHIL